MCNRILIVILLALCIMMIVQTGCATKPTSGKNAGEKKAVEDGEMFSENALIKARYYAGLTRLPVTLSAT